MHISSVGIIGYGRIGSLLGRILSPDFEIFAYDINKIFIENNSRIKVSTLEETASRQLVIYCVPILDFKCCFEKTKCFIKKNAIVMDMLSVKSFPYKLMREKLKNGVSILPAHLMFGPDSINPDFTKNTIVLCPERETSIDSLIFVRNYLTGRGFKIVEMSCDEHDKTTAYSLCVTQLVGRLMDTLNIKHSEIDTQNFDNLMQMRAIAVNDAFDLFTGMHIFNPYAKEMRNKILVALNNINRQLMEMESKYAQQFFKKAIKKNSN